MSNWKECINEQLSSSGISDITKYVKSATISTSAPIDRFYSSLQKYLTLGNIAALQASPNLGPLVAVGVVAATEDYFRGVFSELLVICPNSRRKSASQAINLGSVLWHRGNVVERAAFERTAFSNPAAISEVLNKFFDYPIDKISPLKGQLDAFHDVCELRHCVVHSSGYIQGKNAVALEIAATGSDLEIDIGYAEVQEIAEVCAGMIRTFNTNMFAIMCERWATSWRNTPFWNTANENALFNTLWKIFYSDIDAKRNALNPVFGPVKCRNEIKREYGLI